MAISAIKHILSPWKALQKKPVTEVPDGYPIECPVIPRLPNESLTGNGHLLYTIGNPVKPGSLEQINETDLKGRSRISPD